MKNRTCLFVIWCLLFPAHRWLLEAQVIPEGTLIGILTDSQGAPVANAEVSASAAGTTNVTSPAGVTGTTDVTRTTTDNTGAYKLALPPGSYIVQFSAAGFETAAAQNVIVVSGSTLKFDATLVVGAESEVVAIAGPTAAGSAAQQTDSSIKSIPLSSRNYTQATALAPGVSSQVSNATNIGTNTQGVQVGSGSTSNYMMDGAPIASTTQGPDSPGIPNPDAIEGNNTQSWSYSAGPERYSGANISVVTKSGTDKFHGTLFEFVRNDIFNANDFFVKRAGFPEPDLKQNQFGFTLGGPVWLPGRVLNNRAFFFVSYQGTRQRNGFAGAGFAPSVILPPLPSTRTAASVGSAFCPANHAGDSRYSTVFGGVQVACNGSNINPVAINLLNLKLSGGAYALPGSRNGTFQQQPFSIPAAFREDQLIFNTDYVLTAKHKLAEKFFYAYDPQTSNFNSGPNSLPGTPTTNVTGNIYGVVRLDSMFTPSFSNDIHISGKHELVKDLPQIPFTNPEVGITSVVPQIDLLDQINIAGLFNFGGNGIWDYNSINQYELADQVSWTHGRQSIRSGFEVDRRQWNINVLADARGGLSFNSFPDFLLGLPGCPPGNASCSVSNPIANGQVTNGSSFSNVFASYGPGGDVADVTGPSGIEHTYRFSDASGYIHDDIHLSPRLTLTAGVRWDYFGLPSDTTGNMTSFWPTLANPYTALPAGGTYAGFVVPANFIGSLPATVTRSSRKTPVPIGSPWTDFAPRLSFSLQPLSKGSLVVRGGYGLFYDRPDAFTMEFVSTAEAPYAVPVGGVGQANYQASLAVPFQPAAFGWGTPRTADFVAHTTSNINLGTLAENLSTPQTQKWNLEIQDRLPYGITFLAGYAGAHSIRLLDAERQINEAQLATPGNPLNGLTTSTVENAPLRVPYLGIAANGLNLIETQGAAKYNGVHVLLSEQTSYGLHVQGTYSFSKTLADIGANGGSPTVPGPMASIGIDSNDPLNARQQYGPANLGGAAPPRRLTVNYGWDLPWKSSGMRGKFIGGWGVSGDTIVESGSPITLSDSRGGTIYGSAGVSRAQFCPGMGIANAATSGSVKQRLSAYFNAAAFCAPPTISDGYGYGNSSVGFILTPGQDNTDFSISKDVPIRESKVEFRAEFFNAFNHAQFSGPDAGVTDSSFGQITSTSVNPRLIQFALKYSF